MTANDYAAMFGLYALLAACAVGFVLMVMDLCGMLGED